MLNKIFKVISKFYKRQIPRKDQLSVISQKDRYLKNGQIPWSEGYKEYKRDFIIHTLSTPEIHSKFENISNLKNFAYRLDERAVEYPWIFSKINFKNEKVLDAGSTFNFDFIVNHAKIKNKSLTIYTFAPENVSFNQNRISYVYGDLRDMYFKDEIFDIVISQSTIEHIGMDNSMYGYELDYNTNIETKSYQYLIAIKEMLRVLKPKGNLLLTFPYGKFENHGFFQQFDDEMTNRIFKLMEDNGKFKATYFKYLNSGWCFSTKNEVKYSESYNPHTGRGKKDDFAAHSRAIICIEFYKNS